MFLRSFRRCVSREPRILGAFAPIVAARRKYDIQLSPAQVLLAWSLQHTKNIITLQDFPFFALVCIGQQRNTTRGPFSKTLHLYIQS